MTSREDTVVPVIDIESFLSGSDLQTAPRAIDRAATTSGFFQITGHGIPKELFDGVYEVAAALDALPREVKETIRSPTGYPYRGLMSNYDLQGRLVSEGFTVCRIDSPADAVAKGVDPKYADYFPENVWPPVAGFREAIEALHVRTRALGAALMRAFAVALDLPIDYFDAYTARDTSKSTIRSYPARKAPLEVDPTVIFDEHCDGGMLTMLHQRGTYEGLQVQSLDGQWFPVPVYDDAFVINMGELMMQWTNGKWPATLHRVVASTDPNGYRFTLPTFYTVAVDTLIEPLPTTVGDEGPRFEPMLVYNWERRHLTQSYGRRKFTTATAGAEAYVAGLAKE